MKKPNSILGIITDTIKFIVYGIGGLSLATVCGIISSLGCTAATKKICG